MRCLTLAEALRERGVRISFICREHEGHLTPLLQQRDMPVTVLPPGAIKDSTSEEDYAAWLGVTQDEDAAQTIEALNGETPDWLVVDHYGLDGEWEQRLRPHVSKLMVIDDLVNRHHDCNILLDQNYSAEGKFSYTDLLPSACKLLVGPRYALLRPEYADYRKTLRARDGQIRRVLVFFGGSDPRNMTGLALEALSQPEFRHFDVDVVLGANNPNREELERQSRERPRTTIYGSRPHLADLMAQADLAIGAGGATTWERMCLGLPAVVISIADNQRRASQALAEAQLLHYAGHFSDINMGHLTQLLKRLSHDAERLRELSIKNQLQVDGLGALRLVEALYPSAANEIRLRPACEADIVLYYNWANDPEVRRNAINEDPISWEVHQAWFANKMHNINSLMFVFEAAGLPIGQIRFDKHGNDACIDYSLDPIVRGRGLGAHLVATGNAVVQLREPIRLCAEVKVENHASRAVFMRLGFRQAQPERVGGEYVSFYLDPLPSRQLAE